jgi:signal transduction histidine kinase
MRIRLWPGSLAARTALVLLLGLALVQVAGLTIHALDRMDVQRLGQARDLAVRVVGLYRTMALTDAPHRASVLAELHRGSELAPVLSDSPPDVDLPEMPVPEQRLLRVNMNLLPLGGPNLRWREMVIYGGHSWHQAVIGLRLPDGEWLNVKSDLEPLRPWHSPDFLVAFVLMTAAAAVLTLWAVRRLTAPVRTLAEAAEARIRRFVEDRTELLTAIGHDLRTPITRLKLRAEFLDDDEQRGKILADLEELEAMVSATLAFGRDARTSEPVTQLDLAELLRTILDEAGDANPEVLDKLNYEGPAHLTVQARSLALKRVFVNLIANAVNYAGSATVRLVVPNNRIVVTEIDDDGPGIPSGDLDRVFEPFHRGEPSRNRDTGGVGLGLSIARNIMRAHGGDVTLGNRPSGGVRATVTLPV